MKSKLHLAIGLVLVFTLLVCSVAHTAPITLDYWTGFTGPDGTTMQGLVDQFNKEHEGKIKVNMSVMPWGNFYEKIVAAVISGKAPDVAVMHLDRMAEFASGGVLLPLDDLIGPLGLEGSDYIEAVWNCGVWEGKRYSIPLDAHPNVMYWNKALFEDAGLDPDSPPTDRESFLAITKALTKDISGDGKIDQWGTAVSVGWPNFHIWYSIFYQNGGILFNETNTKATYNSEAGIDALQLLVDYIYEHKVSPENAQVDSEHEAFKRGELGITFNGIWMLSDYKNQPNLKFGAGPVPQWGSQRPAVWAGSHQFVLPKQRSSDMQKVTAALDFVKWIGNHSLEWGFGGQLPAKLSVLRGEEFRQDPYLANIAKMETHIYFPPFFPKYGEATGPIWDAINAAVLRAKSPEEALANAADLSDKILAGK